jgi:hypothetical protein
MGHIDVGDRHGQASIPAFLPKRKMRKVLLILNLMESWRPVSVSSVLSMTPLGYSYSSDMMTTL